MFKQKWLALIALLALLATTFGSQGRVFADDSRTFPETGKTISGTFLDYWNNHGGLAQQGYPISDVLQEKSDTDGKTYTVQYFERAVFELHPENQPPYNVLLTLLGSTLYNEKYPSGAPGQQASTDNPRSFPQTGKTVGGVFRTYWEQNGGLAQQGYPISNEFQEKSATDGKMYTVQYFERAVFEYHPENAGTPYAVLLSLLGKFSFDSKHGQQPTPTATTSAKSAADVYMVGLDNRMFHSAENSAGTFPDFAAGPVGASANLAKDISAVRLAGGRVAAFMVGMDNSMYYSIQNADGSFPGFSGPIASPNNKAVDISVVVLPNHRPDIYMVGLDGRMYHSVERGDGTFPDFALGPVGASANLATHISAVSRPDGRVEVFMIGLDQNIYHSIQNGDGSFPGFAGPVGSAANKAVDISTVLLANGNPDVYMVGLDNRMFHSAEPYPDFAGGPVGASANLATHISAVRLANGQVEVFMIGMDQSMYYSIQNADGSFPGFTGPIANPDNKAIGISVVPGP